MATVDPIRTFRQWLRHGRLGETYIYHVGNLAKDRRTLQVQDGHYREVLTEPIHSLATMVMRAAEHGLVELTQKRIHEGAFQYQATLTKRGKRWQSKKIPKTNQPTRL